MRLSPNFTLAQLTHSDTALARGIANQPDQLQIASLTRLAQSLELVMTLLQAPLTISSAYRSPELNAAVGDVRLSIARASLETAKANLTTSLGLEQE